MKDYQLPVTPVVMLLAAPEIVMPDAETVYNNKTYRKKKISLGSYCLERVCWSYYHHPTYSGPGGQPYSQQAASFCISCWKAAYKGLFQE